MDLPDLEAASVEASRSVREMVADEIRAGRALHEAMACAMEVLDERGNLVLAVSAETVLGTKGPRS